MERSYDVIVVGAGPGGSTAAAFLARAGLDVLLLDRQRFPRDKACGDLIAPSVISILSELGIRDRLEALSYRIEGVRLTSPSGDQVRVPAPSHPQYPNYACVVKRLALDHLISQAAVNAGVRFLDGANVHALREEADRTVRVEAQCSDGRVGFRARVVLVATGASQPLLRSLGLWPGHSQLAFAARAYYEGISGLDRDIQIRFDGVALPGGGWIFPVAPGEANVGAGFFVRTPHTPATAAAALSSFITHPTLSPLFKGSRRSGPVKSYPLRTNFHRSRASQGRVLLVGEAAGLVNPLTGEGIRYAVESGYLASQVVVDCFRQGDLSPTALQGYERTLRDRYQRTFALTHRMRVFYVNPLLLDPMVRACNRWPDLARLVMGVVLSYEDAGRMLRPGILLRALRNLVPERLWGAEAASRIDP